MEGYPEVEMIYARLTSDRRVTIPKEVRVRKVPPGTLLSTRPWENGTVRRTVTPFVICEQRDSFALDNRLISKLPAKERAKVRASLEQVLGGSPA